MCVCVCAYDNYIIINNNDSKFIKSTCQHLCIFFSTIYIHVNVYVPICIHIYVYIRAYMYVWIYMYLRKYLFT